MVECYLFVPRDERGVSQANHKMQNITKDRIVARFGSVRSKLALRIQEVSSFQCAAEKRRH